MSKGNKIKGILIKVLSTVRHVSLELQPKGLGVHLTDINYMERLVT